MPLVITALHQIDQLQLKLGARFFCAALRVQRLAAKRLRGRLSYLAYPLKPL